MKRHRRDQVGFGQQFRPGPRHPSAAGPGDVRPITMLEWQDQTPALRVVGQRRAGPAKFRPTGKAARAQRLVADMFSEGIAAAGALGRRDEREALPAPGAKRTWGAESAGGTNDFTAAQAQRRQHGIEHRPAGVGAELTYALKRHEAIGPAKCADRMAAS